jgi:hypothetical protein
MSARKITIADTFETVEVDLLGVVYRTIPVTRSVQHKLVELEKASGGVLEDTTANPDDQFAYLASIVGLRLEAIDEAAPPATEHIVGLYEADKLRLDQLVGLIDDLGGVEANPTQ